MGLSASERQRRSRAHRSGNHSLCEPDRCDGTSAPAAGSSPARSPIRLLSGVPGVERVADAGEVRAAVDSALAAMSWLGDSDVALRALALRLAAEIDGALERAQELAELRVDLAGDSSAYKRLQMLEALCDVTKTVAAISPQLQAALRDLGGTPASRAALNVDKPKGGKLAQLRSAAGQHDS